MAWIIIGSILGAIALIILIALLLPIYLHIENISDGEAKIYVKILGFKLDNNKKDKNEDSKIKLATEKFLGISKIKDLKSIQKTAKEGKLSESLKEFGGVISSIFNHFLSLIKRCKVNKLYIKIVNADSNAAKAAISYGTSCAVVYTLVGYIEGVANIKKNATELDLSCRYDSDQSDFSYHIVLSLKVFRILGALFKIVKDRAERQKD